MEDSWGLFGTDLLTDSLRSSQMAHFIRGSELQSKQSAVDVANLTPAVYSRKPVRENDVEWGCVIAVHDGIFRVASGGNGAMPCCILHFNEVFWFLSLFLLIEFVVSLCPVGFSTQSNHPPPSSSIYDQSMELIKMQHFPSNHLHLIFVQFRDVFTRQQHPMASCLIYIQLLHRC